MTHQIQLVAKAGFERSRQVAEEAGNETSDLNKRYEKYAAAQVYWQIAHSSSYVVFRRAPVI